MQAKLLLTVTQSLQGHFGAITTMSTDAQGKVLYTASADATIKSWNILTGQVLKVRSISIIVWDVFDKKVQSLVDKRIS